MRGDGEPQHVGGLLGISLLSLQLLVAALGPAPAVHAGGLDVSQRVREIAVDQKGRASPGNIG